MELLKQIASKLPGRWQSELKRIHFARKIGNGTFSSDEPEYALLDEFVRPGDWVLDIGANVGHYTKRLSELVGAKGRVISFEPVPTTFALLAANVELLPHANVTLINAAVSSGLDVVGMSMPKFSTGLDNFYEARVSTQDGGLLNVLSLAPDLLEIDHKITLIKIDVEGHEEHVLAGLKKTIARWRPVLIVESQSKTVHADLTASGYAVQRLGQSPNLLCKP